MLKLHANFGLKTPIVGQDYSSQNYGASIEIELPSETSSEAIKQQLKDAYEMLRDTVEDEIEAQNNQPIQTVQTLPQQSKKEPATNSNSNGKASPKQVKFILDLAGRVDKDLTILNQEVSTRYRASNIQELTPHDASSYIDELKNLTDKAA
ncbi:MAG: hypothetical protein HRT89_24450 [Lentisphaeria bacterium]|nr:hypothetical protein [Lentisphaeria bacterium]NQZ71208.1 hypothetical protein [Lentisphaeria bacterium]